MEPKGAIIVHLHRVDGKICIKGTEPVVQGSGEPEFFLKLPGASGRCEVIRRLKFRSIGSPHFYGHASLWKSAHTSPVQHHYTLVEKMPLADNLPFLTLFHVGVMDGFNVFVLWTDAIVEPQEDYSDRKFSTHRNLPQLMQKYPALGHMVTLVVTMLELDAVGV